MIHDNLEAYMNNTEWFRLSKLVGGITETIPLPDQGTWCKTDYATVMGYTLSTSAPVAGVSAGGSDEMRVVRFGEAATTSTTVRAGPSPRDQAVLVRGFRASPASCASLKAAGHHGQHADL